jgi:hypothetical protein
MSLCNMTAYRPSKQSQAHHSTMRWKKKAHRPSQTDAPVFVRWKMKAPRPRATRNCHDCIASQHRPIASRNCPVHEEANETPTAVVLMVVIIRSR